MTTTTAVHSLGKLRKGIAVRRSEGFERYALAIQYHGGDLLGFSYQHAQEEGEGETRSVEGRLRQALQDTFGGTHLDDETNYWENIQVSSRTDRGVHAWKNTLHVDIRQQQLNDSSSSNAAIIKRLTRGLNFHLSRQQERKRRSDKKSNDDKKQAHTHLGQDHWTRHPHYNGIRILSAAQAPPFMHNDFHLIDPSQPPTIDWNARFSATQRTYVYRILWYPSQHDTDSGDTDSSRNHHDGSNNNNHSTTYFFYETTAIPFEWDRSWRIRCPHLNIDEMRRAARFLQGTHDYSAFQGAKCQRQSPVVTMDSIRIHCQPYLGMWGGWTTTPSVVRNGVSDQSPYLVTIAIRGNSFLYRQVRNMVGCLVQLGKGQHPQLQRAEDVHDLLQSRQRSSCYTTAPAHGLFLVDVQHGNFVF
jgi:tRNA pseudouridine(38-40) synthase